MNFALEKLVRDIANMKRLEEKKNKENKNPTEKKQTIKGPLKISRINESNDNFIKFQWSWTL